MAKPQFKSYKELFFARIINICLTGKLLIHRNASFVELLIIRLSLVQLYTNFLVELRNWQGMF